MHYSSHDMLAVWVRALAQHVFNTSNSHYMQFWLLLAGHAPKHTWRCRGSNPGPFTCKANALPLSYIPNSEISGHIHWHNSTTQEVHGECKTLLLIRASEITFVTSLSAVTRIIQKVTLGCNRSLYMCKIISIYGSSPTYWQRGRAV